MYRCNDCKRSVGPNIPEYKFAKGYRPNGQMTGEVSVCPFCMLMRMNVEKDSETAILVRKTFMKDKTQVMNRSYLMEESNEQKSKKTKNEKK